MLPCSQEPYQKQTSRALRRTASRCTTPAYSRRHHASKTSCRSHRLSTMYRTGVAERCRATHHSPLQTKSSHGVDAASAVLRRSPTPHWQLPSNASRRGSLQAARADTCAKPLPAGVNLATATKALQPPSSQPSASAALPHHRQKPPIATTTPALPQAEMGL